MQEGLVERTPFVQSVAQRLRLGTAPFHERCHSLGIATLVSTHLLNRVHTFHEACPYIATLAGSVTSRSGRPTSAPSARAQRQQRGPAAASTLDWRRRVQSSPPPAAALPAAGAAGRARLLLSRCTPCRPSQLQQPPVYWHFFLRSERQCSEVA